ncbi:BLUF domain-containing protein [Aureimonas flava]|uniref:BLUF domain-containing protein n=1 Tax=Aureimonas flava TaxID=2320271 RepID=A0A3A1WWR0_9HYPH|nr:BLUF domain-containing protein [Aureimonas flava]RIY03452.1 BLUF domain-containing protein [Aureimonas flava]
MLLRLVYVSHLSDDVSQEKLDGIVDRSRVRNERDHVTGMLAVDGRRVLQVLEGPPEAVGRLYSRICEDERHRDVVEIDRRMVETRHFGDWGMVRRSMVDVVVQAMTL